MAKLRKHRFAQKPLEIGVTDKYFRARVERPSMFVKSSFRTIDIGKKGNTKAVIGKPKGLGKTRLQSILIPRK